MMERNVFKLAADTAAVVVEFFSIQPHLFEQFARENVAILEFRPELRHLRESVVEKVLQSRITQDDVSFLLRLADLGCTSVHSLTLSKTESGRAQQLNHILGYFDVAPNAAISLEDRMFVGVRHVAINAIDSVLYPENLPVYNTGIGKSDLILGKPLCHVNIPTLRTDAFDYGKPYQLKFEVLSALVYGHIVPYAVDGRDYLLAYLFTGAGRRCVGRLVYEPYANACWRAIEVSLEGLPAEVPTSLPTIEFYQNVDVEEALTRVLGELPTPDDN